MKTVFKPTHEDCSGALRLSAFQTLPRLRGWRVHEDFDLFLHSYVDNSPKHGNML